MARIQGFLNIPSLVSNSPGVTSPVGELSPHSATFTRNVGYYELVTLPTVGYTSFICSDDDYTNEIIVPSPLSDGILTLGAWIVNRILNVGGYADRASMALALTNNLAAIGADFSVGEFANIGIYNFPEWISWNKEYNGETYAVKVWLADASFRSQFRRYEIVVIPPVDDVDSLWSSFTQVYNLMEARSNDDFLNDVATARGQIPYTHLKEVQANWVNPVNSAQQVSTRWGVIIYGDAGNNDDNKRNAVIDYILANSSHTREEWKTVLPSLFVTTEFIITPLWNRIAVPNMGANTGINSSIFRNGDLLSYSLATAAGYTEAHITTNVEGSVFTYKTLAFSVFGGSENLDGAYKFHQRFPDYLPLHPTQIDFSRMSPTTQGWVNGINAMLPIAETLNENSTLPAEFSFIQRSGVNFIGWRYQNTLYLIAAKSTTLPS